MEIERKWMVKGWPEGLPLREEFAMRQGYISVRPTVRIREEALTGGRTDYILCFKSGGGLAREEIERSIDKALFEEYPTVEAALAWQPESCGLGDYLKDEVTNQPGQSMGEYWVETRG